MPAVVFRFKFFPVQCSHINCYWRLFLLLQWASVQYFLAPPQFSFLITGIKQWSKFNVLIYFCTNVFGNQNYHLRYLDIRKWLKFSQTLNT